MSHEANIHSAQVKILRELLFHPKASYTQLQKLTEFSSDHFNFHIQRLVDLGYVLSVSKGVYALSSKGKEYANRLDTDKNKLEPQPKSAVLLAIRKNIDGVEHFLFQERLKNPYYGFWGIPGGKIRWGETIIEAASRELYEETRLVAEISFGGIYHEMMKLEGSENILEDKIFFVMNCYVTKGKLVAEFEGGRNSWFTVKEARKLSPQYKSFKIELDLVLNQDVFIEKTQEYSEQSF